MSMFFRCYGYLTFENEAEAKKNHEILTTFGDNLYYYFPEQLSLVSNTVTLKTLGNFSACSTCEKTVDVVSKVAENAQFGNVKIDEGDSEDAMWSWRTYNVFQNDVYREHTAPQKSYQFKGVLEFADEETAESACRTLLTDTINSIFTKFPSNQMVFAEDKRLIGFDGKFLQIDTHCSGNAAMFKKTERLLQKIKARSIGGNLEICETFGLRFVPDENEDSSNWVNDMNRDIFYNYSGNLTFHNNEDAENVCQKLQNDEKNVFSITNKKFPIFIANENRVVFDDIGICQRKSFNETNRLIEEFAANAKTGKVEAAFSNTETMDSFVVDRIIPSKVRKSRKDSAAIEKRRAKQK